MEWAEEVIEPRGHSSQEPSIIDIYDDKETYPTHAKKSWTRFKAKPTVVQSSNDSTNDSDLEKENKVILTPILRGTLNQRKTLRRNLVNIYIGKEKQSLAYIS